MALPYNVIIPSLAWSTHMGSCARGPHYDNRFRNRLLMLRHVDQKYNIQLNWSAALHESNCATLSNHLSTRWHHSILLFLQGQHLKTSLMKITTTWWGHLSTRWHHCIYYSFRRIHEDLMHKSYFHYPRRHGDFTGNTRLIYTHKMLHTLGTLCQVYTLLSALGGDFYSGFAKNFIWHYRILYQPWI